jgi:hypothetical protein
VWYKEKIVEIIKEEIFTHNGKIYTIRLFQTDKGYMATGYEGENEATFSHTIEYMQRVTLLHKVGIDYAAGLIDDIKKDIENGCLPS